MDAAASFSHDFAEARGKFRTAARAVGGRIAEYQHPEPGPSGEQLFTDVACFGPEDARRILVCVSGTHGVEGFAGSGAQCFWLANYGDQALPPDVALVMIHAINPYGFAWLRRVTQEGVDLNRNWIDFSKPLPVNPGYDALRGAILPSIWTEASQRESESVFLTYVRDHSLSALAVALHGGQYRHPEGIFYGGAGPTWSRTLQTQLYAEYLGRAEKVGIIDYHSGIGPFGAVTRIVSSSRRSDSFARAASWYGSDIGTSSDGSSPSSRIDGGGCGSAYQYLPQAEVTTLVVEFGTVSPREIVTALRADAWLHAHGDLQSDQGRMIKRQIRDVYYPDRADWKAMAAIQSSLTMRQALAGLAA